MDLFFGMCNAKVAESASKRGGNEKEVLMLTEEMQSSLKENDD